MSKVDEGRLVKIEHKSGTLEGVAYSLYAHYLTTGLVFMLDADPAQLPGR